MEKSAVRILVCLKVIRRMVDREEMYAINPNDENVLEMALKLKENSKDIHITVLSMGPEAIKSTLKELYSYSIDSVIRMTDPVYAGSDTLATSYLLTQAVRQLGEFDLIMCGCYSSDGNTGQVAPEIAARMNRPLISCVTDLRLEEKGILCERITDCSIQQIEAKFPLVITCMRSVNELRVPTLWDIMHAEDMEEVVLTNNDLNLEHGKCGIAGSATMVEKTVKVFHNPRGKAATLDEDAIQKMINILRDAGGSR